MSPKTVGPFRIMDMPSDKIRINEDAIPNEVSINRETLVLRPKGASPSEHSTPNAQSDNYSLVQQSIQDARRETSMIKGTNYKRHRATVQAPATSDAALNNDVYVVVHIVSQSTRKTDSDIKSFGTDIILLTTEQSRRGIFQSTPSGTSQAAENVSLVRGIQFVKVNKVEIYR